MQDNSLGQCLRVSLLIAVMITTTRADESESEARINEALDITTEVSTRYQFELAGKNRAILKLRPNPILRWSNPVAGEVYGNVFVWTHEGRPEVVGSIFQWFSPHTHGSHEFQSLATQGVEGTREGQVVWRSTQPGIELRSVPDQPDVADSPAVRLRQARAISRRFHVQKTDRDGASRELRLLAQPVYRYGGDGSEVLDGSLLVFVQGTDPEVFLMVEARKQDGEKWQWHYALARMNSVKFVATYQDQEVWRTEIMPWGQVKNGRETYTSFGPFEPGSK